ncbi:MAG: thioredoxin domain-containing protein [Deltaproteobacteria bacterium]|nr:thioredoxin domain-containing protein [Deltaproteobacteria bacterium]
MTIRPGNSNDTNRTDPVDFRKNRPNRLIDEKSPYLLQHAYNPVDWHAWGVEAFERAKQEDKPIFLSIGYSTCHWCHVMEKESFEDDEVAELMNKVFVSIKVDREERPDIDHAYMTVCQMMTGGGGWPLNIVMTPDKKPFFAGTYFPKYSRQGRIGLLDLSARIEQLWFNDRAQIDDATEKIVTALNLSTEQDPTGILDLDTLKTAFNQLTQRFDPRYGGFGEVPKFPTPHNILFLLRYWKRSGDEKALQMATMTLDQMRLGGIFDHVGFGFHRYSTDAQWLTPHFEKMLYDQAMLALAYTEAYEATNKISYKKTVEQIFDYVLRDLTSPEGGFYSAEDADSEGEEGKFYLWTLDEIQEILPETEARFVERAFNVFSMGNFKEESTQSLNGRNILHLKRPLEKLNGQLGFTEKKIQETWESARKRLFEIREKRVHPHKDDKILTDWNGLMIAALSKASRVFGNKDYFLAAARAADFIIAKMRDANGRLLRRYRLGEAGLSAHVDDYSFFIWGLLELYETSFEIIYLKVALQLHDDFLERFWDKESGGFFFTADDSEKLLVRQKEIYDGATPSGNSVAAMNLIKLSRICASLEFDSIVLAIGKAFSADVKRFPSAYTQFLLFVDFLLGPSFEVIIVGPESSVETDTMLERLNSAYIPNKVVIFKNSDTKPTEIVSIAPYLKDFEMTNKHVTAFVCGNYKCESPTNKPEKMLSMLRTN